MVEIKVGIIGLSKGNGHPYSFSCIINGYNDSGLKNSGWDGIYSYVRLRDDSDFTFPGVKVTHVWTQDPEESKKIAAAANIPNIVSAYEDFIGEVDAVIIARDDYGNHYKMARPFLEAGLFVFVDKPLSIDLEELRFFKPYLESGHLMSCAGMRYAQELDPVRNVNEWLGEIKLVRGAVLNDFEKYGVHMLDGIFSCVPFKVDRVLAIKSNHKSAVLFNSDDSIIQIDALGEVVKTFQIDFFGTTGRFTAELNNNFSAFRRTLFHFFKMIRERKPSIDPELTLSIMKTIIAFNISLKENREVKVSEVHV
ncbi:Gfo/Idh/MocA family oxidoreductase [Adhaeribacter sp. BT258]|uniref:Gfo/Idh/MocA family oxidoreductase n=1 Tax=Adhaeribacter terrigena TaxID=2793070 RepID=A0ABS1BX36_9BACT|nr:Gfo/Idh/MocA family oxidoreductase [Adhaeribacter terrigena]MBK0401710.1 Gfo/Idh/MocA family oxidoreductase [Adhaeribacter terrigena]